MRSSNAFLAGVLVFGLMTSGCAAPGSVLDSKTKQGAAMGALGGAILGGVIGNHNNHGYVGGALAGAATGALAGGLIGRYLDKQASELDAIPGADVTRRDDSLLVNFSSQLSFDPGSSQLAPGAYDRMREVARTLENYPDSRIVVRGHTDTTERSPQKLSEDRADRVRNFLVSEGIAARRVSAVGYGSSMPMVSNNTREGRAQNRRVEIEIRPDREALEGDGGQ